MRGERGPIRRDRRPLNPALPGKYPRKNGPWSRYYPGSFRARARSLGDARAPSARHFANGGQGEGIPCRDKTKPMVSGSPIAPAGFMSSRNQSSWTSVGSTRPQESASPRVPCSRPREHVRAPRGTCSRPREHATQDTRSEQANSRQPMHDGTKPIPLCETKPNENLGKRGNFHSPNMLAQNEPNGGLVKLRGHSGGGSQPDPARPDEANGGLGKFAGDAEGQVPAPNEANSPRKEQCGQGLAGSSGGFSKMMMCCQGRNSSDSLKVKP